MIDLTEYEKQEQHSEEWFLARRGKITASQVANIIGKGRGTEFSKTGSSYPVTSGHRTSTSSTNPAAPCSGAPTTRTMPGKPTSRPCAWNPSR